MRRFPILMFHSISEAPSGARTPSLYLSPRRFRAYLTWIARLGFRGVSMREATARPSDKLVVLTFDDGFADNVEQALPALQEHGFTATCYVTSGHVGGFNAWDADILRVRTPMMSREQLRVWCDAGMEVGAHTRSHLDLTACKDEDELREEIAGSKEDLEQWTGGAIDHFSYPFGRFDAATVAAVRAAGYSSAVTVRDRRAQRTDDRFQLPRLYVGGTYLMPIVLARLSTPVGDLALTGSP